MIKTNKYIWILVWVVIFAILLICFYTDGNAQEIKQITSWNNSKTINIGNGKRKFEMVMARSFKVEYGKDISGNITMIRNISGGDTISYIPSNFSQYYGSIIDGNYEDNYVSDYIDSNVAKLHIYNETDVVNDTVLVYSRGKLVAHGLNIRVFDKDNKKLKVNKVEKEGNRVKVTAEGRIKVVDPTWSWRPDATQGKDANLNKGAPTTNYGTGNNLWAESHPTNEYKFLLDFPNLKDSITVGGTVTVLSIDTARLYLDTIIANYIAPKKVFGKIYKTAWTEATITWATATDTINLSIGTDTATTNITPDSFNVKNYVRDVVIYDSTNYKGWIFQNATGAGNYPGDGYFSSDYSVIVKRPRIMVIYTATATATATYQGHQPLYDGKFLPLYNNKHGTIYNKP